MTFEAVARDWYANRLSALDPNQSLDTEEPLWRMPAERTRMQLEHLVPLSQQAADLLKVLRALHQNGFVFPAISPTSRSRRIPMIFGRYRMGYRARQTVHGFRDLASTWANEAECYRPDWIELALAHAERDAVRAACNSALYLMPRPCMRQDWADEIGRMIAEPD